MKINPSILRLAGALLPCGFLLHEVAYATVGAETAGAHSYLAYAVPLGVASAAALIAAGLVLPMLDCQERGVADRRAPFALAGALVGIFLVQEGVEILVLGGGIAALETAATLVWLVIPLALALGLLAASAIAWLDRAAQILRSRYRVVLAKASTEPRSPLATARSMRLSPLAFGLACRPPPKS